MDIFLFIVMVEPLDVDSFGQKWKKNLWRQRNTNETAHLCFFRYIGSLWDAFMKSKSIYATNFTEIDSQVMYDFIYVAADIVKTTFVDRSFLSEWHWGNRTFPFNGNLQFRKSFA